MCKFCAKADRGLLQMRKTFDTRLSFTILLQVNQPF